MSSLSELVSLDLAAAAILLAATVIGMLMLGVLASCVIRPWLGEWFDAGRRHGPPQPARINPPWPPPQRSTSSPAPSPWARPPTVRPMTHPRDASPSAARPDDAPFVGAPVAASGRGERLPNVDSSALTSQRDALLAGIAQLRGLLDDDLAADLLNDAMRRGGVSVVDPTGMRVDPSRHRVDHTVAAPDPDSDGVIARTLTPCYLDGTKVLRAADVVVYKWASTDRWL
ncbi:hypothetical protein [Mycobacterium sp.]|uniref:hypothetical protein n=1 Tax=Mycobacterium sp. TaxID=1785 RepID=UPI003BB1DC81